MWICCCHVDIVHFSVNSIMKTRYTKKQICEAIAHWQRVLREDYNEGQKAEANEISLYSLIDDLRVFDYFETYGSKPSRLSTSNMKLPAYAEDALKKALNAPNALMSAPCALCLSFIMSKDEYAEHADEHSSISYEDYIENEKYKL